MVALVLLQERLAERGVAPLFFVVNQGIAVPSIKKHRAVLGAILLGKADSWPSCAEKRIWSMPNEVCTTRSESFASAAIVTSHNASLQAFSNGGLLFRTHQRNASTPSRMKQIAVAGFIATPETMPRLSKGIFRVQPAIASAPIRNASAGSKSCGYFLQDVM